MKSLVVLLCLVAIASGDIAHVRNWFSHLFHKDRPSQSETNQIQQQIIPQQKQAPIFSGNLRMVRDDDDDDDDGGDDGDDDGGWDAQDYYDVYDYDQFVEPDRLRQQQHHAQDSGSHEHDKHDEEQQHLQNIQKLQDLLLTPQQSLAIREGQLEAQQKQLQQFKRYLQQEREDEDAKQEGRQQQQKNLKELRSQEHLALGLRRREEDEQQQQIEEQLVQQLKHIAKEMQIQLETREYNRFAKYLQQEQTKLIQQEQKIQQQEQQQNQQGQLRQQDDQEPQYDDQDEIIEEFKQVEQHLLQLLQEKIEEQQQQQQQQHQKHLQQVQQQHQDHQHDQNQQHQHHLQQEQDQHQQHQQQEQQQLLQLQQQQPQQRQQHQHQDPQDPQHQDPQDPQQQWLKQQQQQVKHTVNPDQFKQDIEEWKQFGRYLKRKMEIEAEKQKGREQQEENLRQLRRQELLKRGFIPDEAKELRQELKEKLVQLLKHFANVLQIKLEKEEFERYGNYLQQEQEKLRQRG